MPAADPQTGRLAEGRSFVIQEFFGSQCRRLQCSAKFSYWDGAIVAAAEMIGASTLMSEDLLYGMRFDKVHVVNPFV
jgi:predicted nucleic acid-binding protein